jgi:hypothetical protein
MDNIFAQYSILMPLGFQDKVKGFVSTGSIGGSRENTPFDRQVDFWFMAVCLAFRKKLPPVKASKTYNATTAEILSRDPHRVIQLQMIALSISGDEEVLLKPKEMFDICSNLANAGIPYLIAILSDTEELPLWNLYTELESFGKCS